jgi:glycosyltransferase involved in cell wall biosynthesis
MNIVFLNPIGSIGGAERVLIDVVSALTRSPEGYRVTVILLTDGPLAEVLIGLGVNVVVLPLPAAVSGMGDSQLIGGNRLIKGLKLGSRLLAESAGLASFVVRLRGAIKRFAPDVLYSNGLKTHLLSAAVKPLKSKLVWHLHDFYGDRPAVAKALGLAAKRADHAVAISHAIKDDMRQLASRLPMTVIYNAVDNAKFAPPANDHHGERLDRLAGLGAAPDGVVRFGMIATYANWKGHLTFLDALASARARIASPVRGYLIGGPIYATSGSQVTETELRERMRSLGLESVVGLIPFQADTSSIYPMLDVVVHASTRPEPFGLTIVEAMSCGRPVIVSASGGAKELFEEGIDGLGHAPGDVRQLADAMGRLGSDAALRQRLGERARQTSCERFSKPRFVDEVRGLLQSL